MFYTLRGPRNRQPNQQIIGNLKRGGFRGPLRFPTEHLPMFDGWFRPSSHIKILESLFDYT